MPVIEASGLTKEFRTYKKLPGLKGAVRGLFRRESQITTAVKEVSFQIEEGELVGFLGPNGAGKTTTLKMLSGLLFPTRGSASVLGFVPWERADGYRRQFALLLGQKNQLWWDLPARESLALNARIYGISEEAFRKTVDELTTLLGVGEKLDVMVRELSLGERMKMELIAALLHRPKVLFLDEPTIGLDVVSQKTVREFLREHNRTHRTTIVLTSHYMQDIQELCHRVIVIDKGQIMFDGALSKIVDRFADFKLVRIHCDAVPSDFEERVRIWGEVTTHSAVGFTLKIKRDRVIAACKALLDGFPVVDIDIEEMPIEDIIRQLFAREPETKPAGRGAGGAVVEGT